MKVSDEKVVKKWWNCWLLHRWGEWGEPYSHGYTVFQRRECLFCGKIKEEKFGHSKRDE